MQNIKQGRHMQNPQVHPENKRTRLISLKRLMLHFMLFILLTFFPNKLRRSNMQEMRSDFNAILACHILLHNGQII